MVFDMQRPSVYRALLAVVLGAGIWLALRQPQKRAAGLAAWFALIVAPGLWAAWRLSANVGDRHGFPPV